MYRATPKTSQTATHSSEKHSAYSPRIRPHHQVESRPEDDQATRRNALAELHALLDSIRYQDHISRILLGTTIYEVDRQRVEEAKQRALAGSDEALAIAILRSDWIDPHAYGRHEASLTTIRDGLRHEHNSALQQRLIELADDTGCFRFNDYTIASYALHDDRNLHVLVDIPDDMAHTKDREASAQIAVTSSVLLQHLQSTYGGDVTGVAADFGSGVGVQGLALLMMNPGLQRVYGLDIDPQGLYLSRLNAEMNLAASDRFVPVYNGEEDALSAHLAQHGHEELNLIVANPPFNIVPDGYGDVFTDFGDGGPDGLSVITPYLLRSLVANHLGPGGELAMYAGLGREASGRFLIEDELARLQPASVNFFTGVNNRERFTRDDYASALADWLLAHGKIADADYSRTKDDIASKLETAGIATSEPAFVRLRLPAKNARPPRYDDARSIIETRQINPTPGHKEGGVYLQTHPISPAQRANAGEALVGFLRTRVPEATDQEILQFLRQLDDVKRLANNRELWETLVTPLRETINQ